MRTIHGLLLLMIVCIVCSFVLGNSKAETYQQALWFMDDLNITQVPGGGYSHAGTLNFDVVGVNNKNIKAPFDCKIVALFPGEANGNTIVIQSTNRVEYANGTIDYMSMAFGHDNNISDCYVGKTINQGVVFCQNGDYGHASGVHSHVTCIAGKYTDHPGWIQVSTGKWTFRNAILPTSALYITETTNIVNTKGLSFKLAGKPLIISAEHGNVTGTASVGRTTVAKGKTVTLTAKPNGNYLFLKWTAAGVTLSNTTSETISFTMPNNEVSITAEFIKDPSVTVWEYQNLKVASKTKTDATLTGALYYSKAITQVFQTINPTFYLIAGLDQNAVRAANPEIYPGAHVLYIGQVTPTTSGLYDYTFPLTATSIVSGEISGGTNWLSAGQTFYYKWFASQNGAILESPVQSGATVAASSTWNNLRTNDSNWGLFNGDVYWPKSLTMQAVGCFVSTDRSKVLSATPSSHNGVAFKQDTSNIKTTASMTTNTTNGTVVFYRGPSFDTISSFTPGVTYYYKFYSKTGDNEIVYSSIATYVPSGTATKYQLTLQAETGGSIIQGTSGSYASGNVIAITAKADNGYTFDKWTTTAGTLASSTNPNTTFTMPASAATVKANFAKNHYFLYLHSSDGGEIISNNATTYAYGSQVEVRAQANDGYKFAGWRSDEDVSFVNDNATETTFTMPACPVNIYADFAEIDYRINLLVLGGDGTIFSSHETAKCGEIIQLTAVPADNNRFTGWSCGEIVLTEPSMSSISVTMPGCDITMIATFDSISGIAYSDWLYGNAVPSNLDPSLLDIEYNHHYEIDSIASPGSEWAKGEVVHSEYINNGSSYESDFPLATSNTRVLLNYYYYHWCTVEGTQWVNYQATSRYVHYDQQSKSNQFYEYSSQPDGSDSRYICYTLKWNNGSWLACKGGETCSYSHDYRSHYWYKRYIYQDKKLQETYRWTKESGWVSSIDPSATSYTVRWKMKNNIQPDLVLPMSLERIEAEAFINVKNVMIQVPESVNYISETAFDPSVIILCTTDSYAEERCYELGLTVFSR